MVILQNFGTLLQILYININRNNITCNCFFATLRQRKNEEINQKKQVFIQNTLLSEKSFDFFVHTAKIFLFVLAISGNRRYVYNPVRSIVKSV